MTFKIDLSDFKELTKDLKVYRKKAMPFAARAYANDAAFAARKVWQNKMRREYILKNKFTVNSVRVQKAQGLDVRTMQSEVGSIASYLADQEDGATLTGGGKHGKPIPTSEAAGQGKANPRTRLVRKRNKLASIRLTNRGGKKVKGSKKKRSVATIAIAKAAGDQFVFLDLGSSKGIFSIRGGKLKMIWSLSQSTVKIKPGNMLGRTVTALMPTLDARAGKAIRNQLRRHRIFGF